MREMRAMLVIVLVFFASVGMVDLITDDHLVWGNKKQATQTVERVGDARELLLECTRGTRNAARVETRWEGKVPAAWVITCEYRP